eukprot:s2156_g13.t1
MLPPLLAQNCADSAPPACGAHAHMTSSHVQSPTYSKAASLLWLQGAKDAQQHTDPLKPKKLLRLELRLLLARNAVLLLLVLTL